MPAPSTERFTIRRKLGEGGMGAVYEAFDNERRAPVALKTLLRFDGVALARFKREFRALQGLSHPNLVSLDELFFEGDQWFFTMELVGGVDFVSYVRGASSHAAFDSTIRGSVAKLEAKLEPALPLVAPVQMTAPPTSGSFDEAKLRDALRQLVGGLAALHAVDKVHRDVKPSNVVVTPDGRVVLLDFGLVTEGADDERSSGSAVVGTPAYMAPEQAASRELGPAADLYAVGVMLYEALTGKLPIDGAQLQILIEKQTREPAAPSSIAEGVPADLDALCVALLHFDPARRPSTEDVLRALSVPVPRASGPDVRRTSTDAPTFVGRSAELTALRAAYDSCARGQLATALVCGESGIGKSYLVRRFTTQLLAERPDAMILEGRCYEREAVSYKTLDGIADALSRRLSRLSPAEVAALLPVRCAVLAQVFPVMLRVAQVAKEHASFVPTLEPHEMRQRAFVALRELLSRLALQRPTVIVIDDMQWADEDGLRALAEILRPPEAPPLLVIGTVRVTSGSQDADLQRLRDALGDVRVLTLENLGHADARELAIALLRRTDNPDADPERIAKETGGHPLFVEELARHLALGGSARADVTLDDAILSRIAQLEEATRAMAEVVVVAGKPTAQEIVAAAGHLEPAEFHRRAAALRAANVVRTGGTHWGDAIEPYHDRVREAVLAHLAPERRRSIHEALAVAFESSSNKDPETLATHWREAGHGSRAARYATAAGDQASSALAFDRATQWYEDALGLSEGGPAATRELRIKLGDAQALAGRGAIAAEHFEAAARESPPAVAIDLRRRAAEQLLRAGEIERGLDATRGVLAAVDLAMPRTHFGVVVALLWYRLILRLRGLGFVPRDASYVSPRDLTRIDVCWSVSCSMFYADVFTGALFQTRHLLLALRAGERRRVTRALAIEVGLVGGRGSHTRPRVEKILERARAAATGLVDPYSEAIVSLVDGISHVMTFRFERGVALLQGAIGTFRAHCPGTDWEVATGRYALFLGQFFLGQFVPLREAQEAALKEAIDRGDRYAAVMIRVGATNRNWLITGDVARARRELDLGLRAWPKRPFTSVHFMALVESIYIALCELDVERAAGLLRASRRDVRRSMLLEFEGPRLEFINLSARIALSTAAAAARQGRSAPLGDVHRAIRVFRRLPGPLVRANVMTFEACLASVRGAPGEALAHLEALARDKTDEGWLPGEAARLVAGRMRGGPDGEAMVLAATAALASRGILAGKSFIAAQLPGLERYMDP